VSYKVSILPSAEKEMERLPVSVHIRITRKILTLENNPRPRGVKKLSGRDEYRLRVGDYRVLYVINNRNRVITVSAVGHRRDVYD
jgi:mRNA interferase RelE/StbE